MIQLTSEQLKTVKDILKKHVPNAKVLVFGSRVNGNSKPFSDLDLAIDNNKPLSPNELANLRDDFSESNLTIKVDLVDWYSIEESFQKKIAENHEYI